MIAQFKNYNFLTFVILTLSLFISKSGLAQESESHATTLSELKEMPSSNRSGFLTIVTLNLIDLYREEAITKGNQNYDLFADFIDETYSPEDGVATTEMIYMVDFLLAAADEKPDYPAAKLFLAVAKDQFKESKKRTN